MLSEGLLALVSLIAYMVLAPSFFAQGNYPSWVEGAIVLTSPFLGGRAAAGATLTVFFGLVLVIYALTVQALVTRFFRLVSAEAWWQGRFRLFGNIHLATAGGCGIRLDIV